MDNHLKRRLHAMSRRTFLAACTVSLLFHTRHVAARQPKPRLYHLEARWMDGDTPSTITISGYFRSAAEAEQHMHLPSGIEPCLIECRA